jgi:isoquinoline 1-oxidoreductase beta subunit
LTLKQRSDCAHSQKTWNCRRKGNAAGALSKDKKISANYEYRMAHATMEPLNAVIDFREDSCDIWTGTQFQTVDRNSAAEVLDQTGQVNLTRPSLGRVRRRANHSDFV